MQACGTPRGSRRPRTCGAPRSACRPDGRRARPRTPPRPRPRRGRRQDRARRSRPAGAAPACRPARRGRLRSPRRSAPASTSRSFPRRGSRRERPQARFAGQLCGICGVRRTRTRRTPPTRPARRRARTRRCRTDRAVSCATASRFRPSGGRIEPRRRTPAPPAGSAARLRPARAAAPGDRRFRRFPDVFRLVPAMQTVFPPLPAFRPPDRPAGDIRAR